MVAVDSRDPARGPASRGPLGRDHQLVSSSSRHNRGITRAHIGTTIDDPNVDFAKIAQGLGVHAQGPITNPNDLGPAIKRALDVVKRGEPSLIDVVTQPR